MPKLKLTADAIHALEVPAHGEGGTTRQVLYYDELQPGLGVRVTSGGSRVYVVEASHNGQSVRVKLASCSVLTLTQARQRAREVLGEISKGINPNERRRADRARTVSFAQAFEAYVASRKAARRLAPRTEYDYRRLIYGTVKADGTRNFDGYLSPWRALPLASITRDMVRRKHADLVQRSGAQANYCMRLLSAVWNFSRAGAEAIGPNPVEILRELKAWVRIDRRQTKIQVHELAPWFAAVLALKGESNNHNAEVVRDYLLSLMLTGHRPGEWARLKVAGVDLKARTATVRKTKNGTDHTLPLSDYLLELLRARLDQVDGEYVFPAVDGTGHLVEPKKMVVKVRAASGVSFTPADLRRTFVSIAESLDIPAYALKRLLNHKMANDVTAGYIVTDVERLRAPMQKVTDYVLRAAGLRPSAEVTALPMRAAS